MPIYEYQCDGCQEVFEVRQRMTDPAPERHACGSTKVHRVLSATSFVLKGTGWYATDYGNRSNPPPSEPGSKSDGDGAGKADVADKGKATGDNASSKPAADKAAAAPAAAKPAGPKGGGSPAAA